MFKECSHRYKYDPSVFRGDQGKLPQCGQCSDALQSKKIRDFLDIETQTKQQGIPFSYKKLYPPQVRYSELMDSLGNDQNLKKFAQWDKPVGPHQSLVAAGLCSGLIRKFNDNLFGGQNEQMGRRNRSTARILN